MPLEAAPAPRNKAILLKELPAHRAVGRHLFGHVTPDGVLARHKTELLPLVNDVRETESESEPEPEHECFEPRMSRGSRAQTHLSSPWHPLA